MFEEVEKIYKPGTDILDIGTHSLMFSELGNVFAFEPIYHEVTELNIKNKLIFLSLLTNFNNY